MWKIELNAVHLSLYFGLESFPIKAYRLPVSFIEKFENIIFETNIAVLADCVVWMYYWHVSRSVNVLKFKKNNILNLGGTPSLNTK